MRRREVFGGLHFFNPVPAMKLVEVVRGEETGNEAYDVLCRFCQRIGKTPMKCKDSPGFIVNRLLIPYLADAMRMSEAGNAGDLFPFQVFGISDIPLLVIEVRDIDTAMRLGTGHPMGPFELMDYIGLWVTHIVLPYIHRYVDILLNWYMYKLQMLNKVLKYIKLL